MPPARLRVIATKLSDASAHRRVAPTKVGEIVWVWVGRTLASGSRMTKKLRCAGILGALALVLLGPASRARACTPPLPPAATAIPRVGTTGVSTATSIVVVSPSEPFGVGVLANGQAVPVSGWSALGAGIDVTGGPTSFWQLRLAGANGLLAASTDYVVTSPGGADGGAATLTTFSTAAGYDKLAGTAPSLRSVHLWRVRYPVADIASGNCVFAEYASFVTVDYDAATIPNTAPGSVIQSFQLVPDTGGTAQTFVYTGEQPFTGLAPSGAYPLPLGPWQPDLDPTRRYCLAIGAIGDGNLARLGTASNQVCADVVQLSATGAPPPPSIGGGPDGGATGGVGGGPPGGGPKISSGGCATAGTPASWAGLALVAAGLGLGVGMRRRRRARARG
jgi:MYXO-CTERM domain-containing protein